MVAHEPLKVNYDLRARFSENSKYNASECYQCGTCTATCPVNDLKENKLTVRKVLHQAQLGLVPDSLVWECTSCAQCEASCPREVDIVGSIHDIRNMTFETRTAPKEMEALLWNILEEANPMGEAKAARGTWARDLNLHNAAKEDVDVLFYVGGPAAYDPRLQRVAQLMTKILDRSGVSYGILGTSEPSSGEAVREAGVNAYLDHLIDGNVQTFNDTGVSKIVSLSPHAHDIFKKVYPEHGLEPQVMHYTEFLNDLWNKNELKMDNRIKGTVTYHDPCYLGRYNNVYEQPRALIEGIPGLELVEMKDNKSNALCCGGGGNQMYRDTESGLRLGDVRMEQAKNTTAEYVLSSCGYCIQNLEDANKTANAGMQINDIIELVAKSMGVSK